eukprot:CAMPEP_0182429058 /NCGR_PEP_ID=MMETSP1167-20130531/25477_1 /TAXON_ID=2988 /ORGANISM="Mallomonas Sp, Strain CCMP3275" /LENGTH=293 /DNA_ID=CAMNT_0024612365 /DNA_START=207 /DNA_END=1088 /DNA_ORIENTATION=-
MDPREFKHRLQIFANNHDLITAHNEKELSYTLGHNQFSAMSYSEFRDYVRLGSTRPGMLRKRPHGIVHEAPEDVSTLPKEIDWVEKGAVTEVKNQGQCGSCWSFSAVGALEGAYFLKYGKLISFSEQELVSCDNKDYGCNGGFMDDAFAWIESNGGLCTEDDYKYTSGGGSSSKCEKKCKDDDKAAPKSYNDVKVDDVKSMMSALAQQPVAIAIEADQFAFQFYKGGVLSGSCGQNLDHGVLAVGYGTYSNGMDYWKVKNSWGDKWGMDGYILIEKGEEDLCGVCASPVYPVL